MVISDETLAAYAAGGLSARGRREVEAALADHPDLLARLEALQGASAEVQAPIRLTALEGGARARPATVVDIGEVRSAKTAAAAPPKPAAGGSAAGRWIFAGFALLTGLILGRFILPGTPVPFVGRSNDGFVAQGALAQALNHRQSQAADEGPVRLGYSFQTNDGALCRTFQIMETRPKAGIACRDGSQWRIRMITSIAAHPGEAEDPLIRQAVAAIIDGGPLAPDAEAQVLGRR